jgi:hypothetical protein
MQNTPNPDVNSPNAEDVPDADIERGNEDIPTPPDRAPNVPIEEPPDTEKPPIEDDGATEPKRIV